MSLTKQDLKDISGVIVETVGPMFEDVGEQIYELKVGLHEQKIVLDEHTRTLHEQGNRLRLLTDKIDTIDGKLAKRCIMISKSYTA